MQRKGQNTGMPANLFQGVFLCVCVCGCVCVCVYPSVCACTHCLKVTLEMKLPIYMYVWNPIVTFYVHVINTTISRVSAHLRVSVHSPFLTIL